MKKLEFLCVNIGGFDEKLTRAEMAERTLQSTYKFCEVFKKVEEKLKEI